MDANICIHTHPAQKLGVKQRHRQTNRDTDTDTDTYRLCLFLSRKSARSLSLCLCALSLSLSLSIHIETALRFFRIESPSCIFFQLPSPNSSTPFRSASSCRVANTDADADAGADTRHKHAHIVRVSKTYAHTHTRIHRAHTQTQSSVQPIHAHAHAHRNVVRAGPEAEAWYTHPQTAQACKTHRDARGGIVSLASQPKPSAAFRALRSPP